MSRDPHKGQTERLNCQDYNPPQHVQHTQKNDHAPDRAEPKKSTSSSTEKTRPVSSLVVGDRTGSRQHQLTLTIRDMELSSHSNVKRASRGGGVVVVVSVRAFSVCMSTSPKCATVVTVTNRAHHLCDEPLLSTHHHMNCQPRAARGNSGFVCEQRMHTQQTT